MNKLYKNEENKVICGVCAGMAEYLNIDVTIVRLLWVIASLTLGCGVLAYIIFAMVMPKKPMR